MTENSNTGQDSLKEESILTPEEILGPPSIDLVGVFLMMLVAVFVGFFCSVGILVASFLSMGKFSLESGISPMLLAMITFFVLIASGYIYIWGARTIFGNVYTRGMILYLHTTVYMVILYICMLPIYMIIGSMSTGASGILISYLIHILLAVFGFDLLISMLSQYRYVLLAFYANLVSIIVSGAIVFWIFQTFSTSGSALFILMVLSVLAFFLTTTISFFLRYLYYHYYSITGNDPLGNVFISIEQEEFESVRQAKEKLLQKN